MVCTAMVLAAMAGEAGASGMAGDELQTAVSHSQARMARLQQLHDRLQTAASQAPAAGATGTAPTALVVAAMAKKGGAAVGTPQLKSMAKRFKQVHGQQLAKIRLGEKALIGTFPNPSAKNVKDSLEWLPFVLPPLGLFLLGAVAFGVVTIRKQHKIPHMPTQGRLDIKDVQASAAAMGQGGRMQQPV